MTQSAWPQPGHTAVSLYIGTSRTARWVRIARLTGTQIVTTDGERYRRSDGRMVGEKGGRWGGHTELRSPTDPDAINTLARQEWLAVLSQTSPGRATRVVTAADALAELDRIAGLVAAARAQILHLTEES